MNISSLEPLNTKYMRIAYAALLASILLLAIIGPSLLIGASDDSDDDDSSNGDATICDGTISTVVSNDIVVPRDTLCILADGAVVFGDVNVKKGGAIRVETGVTIFGDLVANQPGPLFDVGTRSPDAVNIGLRFPGQALPEGVNPTTIMGNLVVKGSTGFIVTRFSSIAGDVIIEETDGGPGIGINIHRSVVGGDIKINDNEVEFVNLSLNIAGGDIEVENNIDVDDSFPGFAIFVIGNTMDGNLQCQGNVPTPVASGGAFGVIPNIVGGDKEDQCAGL